MNNAFNNLPSYIRETPKFSQFLEMVNAYIFTAALEVAKLKESFVATNKSTFVVKSLASQLGVTVDIPFVDGKPDMEAYYKRLYLAYRARSFVVSFKGSLADFITGDPLKDVCTLTVLDFSVAKDNKSPMSVVYSCMSMDQNLTLAMVKDLLIPRVTGVDANLYYLQFGQDVFGYDLDERTGKRIGANHVSEESITEAKFSVNSAVIKVLGAGYVVGDVVTTTNGIKLKIDIFQEGAFLLVVDASKLFVEDPSRESEPVTGGSGTGMLVNVNASNTKGYFVRGFDDGVFLSVSNREDKGGV